MRHDPEGSRYEKRALAPVNISAVTDEMHHERMLFLVRYINNSVTPYSQPVESLEFACQCLRREMAEILRQPL